MSNACALHPCDECVICAAGDCCGSEVVTLGLPVQGTWPGVHFAPLGALQETDTGEVVCHICGWEGHALSHHVQSHGLSADEYRAYFGLCTTQGLTSPSLHARMVEAGARNTQHAPDALIAWNDRATSEQRALVSWNREQRLQRRAFFDPEKQRARSLRRSALMKAEPERAEKLSIKVRLAKRVEDGGRECPECHAIFCTWTSRRGSTTVKATTCLSPECIRSAKSRAARKRQPGEVQS